MLDFNDAAPQLQVIDPDAWTRRVEHVRATLPGRAREFVADLFPRARLTSHEARVGSVSGEPGESLSIGLTGERAGLWHDHATGQGGDLIDLWREMHTGDFRRAVEDLERWLGFTPAPRWSSAVTRLATQRKAEAEREPRPEQHLGAPVASWHYLAADNATVLAIVRRYDLDETDPKTGKRKKTFRPFRADGSAGMPDPRPLYRLPNIKSATEVVLTEGEKAADALATIGVEATSAMGGSKADPAKTDWTPLAGKTVLVWEDNDTAGEGLTERVRPSLEAIGCVVGTIRAPTGKPASWDAADAVAEGEDVPALLTAAKPREATASSFKFNITFFRDIPAEHHKTWLVRDVFGANELTVVYGAPGCGKSVLIGDAAAHVAAGLPWFGRRTMPCAVLYVAAERHALVKRRLAAWRKRHGILDVPVVVLDGLFNFATDPEHGEEILRIAAYVERELGMRVGWIIVDTKAQVMGGGDENASKDISVLNNNLARMQTIGAHVTVIDHTPQSDPRRMKGNGGLAGAADGSWLVEKADGVRTFTAGSKAPNDGPDDLTIAFTLESVLLGVNAEGEETTAPVVVEAEQIQAPPEARVKPEPAQRLGPLEKEVLAALGKAASAGQGLRFMRLRAMTTASDDSALNKCLRRLIEKGQITKAGEEYLLP